MAILQAILPCTTLSKTPILCFSQTPSNSHLKLHDFIKNSNQKPKLSFNKLHAIASDVAVGSSASGEEDEVFVGPSSEAEVRGEREVADYDWTEEWYPLYLTTNIPEDAPLGLSVFHKQLVLFRDASGELRCYEDRCPHRLAKLSEGQLVDDCLKLFLSEMEEIGEFIGELTQLIRLEFWCCESLKCVPANIGQLASLANLPKLTSLSLSSELPSNLGHLKKCLSHLSLDHCDWEELPATVCQLGSLTHLDLFFCKNIKFRLNSIANLSNLTFLSLTHCKSLVELPASIGQLMSLTHLKIFCCKNIKSLLMSIANLSKLTSLYLEYCDFLTELPSNLGQMKSRSHLQLDSCNNIKSLPDSMKDLCSLDTLFIRRCNSLTQLPINLNVLHLELIDCSPHFLPTGLINLKYLRVTFCSCSDESFANLKDPYSLQHLSISGCFRHNYDIKIKVPARLMI